MAKGKMRPLFQERLAYLEVCDCGFWIGCDRVASWGVAEISIASDQMLSAQLASINMHRSNAFHDLRIHQLGGLSDSLTRVSMWIVRVASFTSPCCTKGGYIPSFG